MWTSSLAAGLPCMQSRSTPPLSPSCSLSPHAPTTATYLASEFAPQPDRSRQLRPAIAAARGEPRLWRWAGVPAPRRRPPRSGGPYSPTVGRGACGGRRHPPRVRAQRRAPRTPTPLYSTMVQSAALCVVDRAAVPYQKYSISQKRSFLSSCAMSRFAVLGLFFREFLQPGRAKQS